MNIWEDLVKFFQGGGTFMFPIAIVLVIGLSIGIERYIYLVRVSTRNRQLWNQIVPMLSQGQFPAGGAGHLEIRIGHCADPQYGLARIQAARRRDDIEKAMEESLMEVVPRLEKRTHYLATFANLATLLGLLGTVMGLINAFHAVATVNPAEKANLLSASISVAMNCTAFGLMTAVPLLFIHAFLQTKTTELVDSLEMASVKFLNAVTERRPRGAGSRCGLSRKTVGTHMRRSYDAKKLARRNRRPAELMLVPMIDNLHRAGDLPADDRRVLPHGGPCS